jgi:hypothetical protein
VPQIKECKMVGLTNAAQRGDPQRKLIMYLLPLDIPSFIIGL